MKFNFKKYYNRLTLIILLCIVIITGLAVNIVAFINANLHVHIISTIIIIALMWTILHLMNKEDKRISNEATIKIEDLNKVIPALDRYLHDKNPNPLYVSYNLYSTLHVSEIGSSIVYTWFNGTTQMLTDTILIVDSNMEKSGYWFGIEPRTKYINSIDDLYETEN